MKIKNFTKEQLIQFVEEMFEMPDAVIDYLQNENTNWDAERLLMEFSSLKNYSEHDTQLLDKDNDIDVVGKCANCGVEYHIHK